MTSYVEFRIPDVDSYLFTTLNEDVGTGTDPLLGDLKRADYEVKVDYGMHVENHATEFFEDVSSFIDFDMTLLTGDKVTVYYTGEIYIQETYPERPS